MQRIDKLFYRLEISPNSDYSTAPDKSFDGPLYSIEVSGQLVEVTLKQDCERLEQADALVADFFRRWEMTAGLLHRPGEISFVRTGHKAVCTSPLASERTVVFGNQMNLSAQVRIVIKRGAYPDFPSDDFELSPDVASMYGRFQGYMERREPLLSMAYMCLTILEISAGSRHKAAIKYLIDERVLRHLGDLTSTRGGDEARKAKGLAKPLVESERIWIESTVKLLIRRAEELAAGRDLEILRFDALPPL